jgi:hypothetical protein
MEDEASDITCFEKTCNGISDSHRIRFAPHLLIEAASRKREGRKKHHIIVENHANNNF